ncbi:MAG: monovalent cation/H(+) antiporter subunit G [Deltaproteobacteria bacterium]|nr:monovalent cation/H(+) antiporter subunit G [Deltaproteobacteria bacterium]
MEMTGAILLLLASIVFLVSALGLVRMPDVYNRIQTSTKATTLGTILAMAAVAFLHPDWTPKLALVVLFILLTNPISSHVVARAAYFKRVKLSDRTVEDQLKDKLEG